jgi:cytochrome c biogenesis protein CcmG/thiol:disulfide interchange protein DsbE
MTKKTTYIILAVAILAVIGMYFYNKYNVAPTIDIAKLEVVTQDDQKFDIASLKGKKVIVSFYASWCPPCREELKTLHKIKDQKLTGYEILAITDENLEKLIEFKEKNQYTFTFLALTKVFSEIGINSIPTTYLLNAKGEIVYNNVGFIDWEDPSTLEHLTGLMQ